MLIIIRGYCYMVIATCRTMMADENMKQMCGLGIYVKRSQYCVGAAISYAHVYVAMKLISHLMPDIQASGAAS